MLQWIGGASLVAAASALALPHPAAATSTVEGLPRKAMLGVTAAPLPPELSERVGAGGVLAEGVTAGLTGERLGLRRGDVILSVNGRPVAAPNELVEAAGQLTAGEPVTLAIWRDGTRSDLGGTALPRPLESYSGATTRYGAVPFGGGLLRDIMVTPERPATGRPTLYLLQGFTCASIDYLDPATSHRQLIQRLVDRGIAVYRVEKPGVGDSRAPRPCATIDFDEEVAAFQAAYDHLQTAETVDPDRIFLLGHSLGGLQAPLLAAKTPPRGVAVYGTVLRNWYDYHFDVSRFQATMFGNGDPVDTARQAERMRGPFQQFYLARQPLRAVAASSAETDRWLRQDLGWDGGDSLLGRHESFWHDLPAQPLIAAWRDSRSRVLALYGESDIVALNDEDHRLIATIVNHYRPGTATCVEVAGADHGMYQVGNREAVQRAVRSTGAPPQGPFEPRVAEALASWIEQSMAAPPVRTLSFPAPARPPAQPG